jgi:hypothetical protein
MNLCHHFYMLLHGVVLNELNTGRRSLIFLEGSGKKLLG